MTSLFLLSVAQSQVRFMPPAPLLLDGAPFSVGGGHAAPAVVDLNGDGLDDLVVGQYAGGTFNVFFNSGSASKPAYSTLQTLMVDDKPASVDYGCCIGGTPQFVDLDRDGTVDLVSGSYTRGVSFFRGLGGGRFASSVTIVEPSVGVALAPALADWDGDGDFDMVLGTQGGDVLLLSNDGAMRFGEPVKLSWDGNAIKAEHGGPCVFDFDKDGVLDLLIGDLHGNLTLYRGRLRGASDLTPGRSVLPAFPSGPMPAQRLKPTVVDWNRDGKADILAGDFRANAAPVTPLPPEKAEEAQRLTTASSALAFRVFMRMGDLESAAMREVGLSDLKSATPKQRAQYDAALTRLVSEDAALKELREQKSATDKRLEEVRAQKPIEGTVWVLYGL